MKTYSLLIGGIAVLVLLGGCADSRQTRIQTDFGTSKNLLVLNQTYNPEAEANLDPVTGLDPAAAESTIRLYRASFGKPTQTTTYTINIGK